MSVATRSLAIPEIRDIGVIADRRPQREGEMKLPAGARLVSADNHWEITEDIFHEHFPLHLREKAPRVWFDGKTARVLAGRYADRLERRGGAWKIALRRTTVDILLVGDAAFLTSGDFGEFGYLKGMRDRRDVSYQRPLTLDETTSDRW